MTLGDRNTKTKFPSPCSRQLLGRGLVFCSVLFWGWFLVGFFFALFLFFAPGGSAFALNSFTSTWENHTYCLDYYLLRPSGSTHCFG